MTHAADVQERRGLKAVTASKVVLESIGLRDRPESLIRELYAAAGPLHAEAAPGQLRPPLEQALKQEERAAATAGLERWACYAVNDATGDWVGLTDIVVNSAAPERVHVGNTAVEPAHRGRALGKWLKAAMTQQALDELPAAHWLVTSNAASNEAMLSINR